MVLLLMERLSDGVTMLTRDKLRFPFLLILYIINETVIVIYGHHLSQIMDAQEYFALQTLVGYVHHDIIEHIFRV